MKPAISVRGAALLAALLVVLAIVPPAIGGYLIRAITSYLIFGLLALSVGLITGYGRLFNVGVGAVFGVSGYCIAMLSQQGIFNPWLLLLCSVATGVIVSVLFGLYALMASGTEYLMLTFLTTLAFAGIPKAAKIITGGDNGLSVKGGLEVSFGLNPLRGNGFYWLVLGVTAGCALLSWYVLSSQAGRAVRAIGRNPIRAAAMGYNVAAYRMALTLFSGLVAALGGWLYALQNSFVFEGLLGLSNSLNGLVFALIGGVDTILGPLIGAAGLKYITDLLSQRSTQSSLYIGIVLLLVVYLIPDGLLGLASRLRRRSTPSAPAPSEDVAAPELALKPDQQTLV